MKKLLLFTACLFCLALYGSRIAQATDDAWLAYKTRFMQPDGRIVDTGNKGVSHSEGQGYAMLLAVTNDDRVAFDQLWNWTNNHLKNNHNGLFFWRYDPHANPPVSDKNNASDGDMLIAWALLKAGKQWSNNDYIHHAETLGKAILRHNTLQFANQTVMLPGVVGFNKDAYLNLNPSYFIFPAWQDFANHTQLNTWQQLIQSSQQLLKTMHWGKAQLPSDWVTLHADGSTSPAKEWPARASYDAIRIPLYLYWHDPNSPLLTPWRVWWQSFPRDNTPAWTNVLSNENAPVPLSGGLLAVRDLVLNTTSSPVITAHDDYYSASLKMLVKLAQHPAAQTP